GGDRNAVAALVQASLAPAPGAAVAADLTDRPLRGAEGHGIVVIGERAAVGRRRVLRHGDRGVGRGHAWADGRGRGKEGWRGGREIEGGRGRRAIGIGGGDGDSVAALVQDGLAPGRGAGAIVLGQRALRGAEGHGVVVVGEGAAVGRRGVLGNADGGVGRGHA